MMARMKSPAATNPEVMSALVALGKASSKSGVAEQTLELVHLRASQINGCSMCVSLHSLALKRTGESDERIFALAAWRESILFSDAERAALALTEAATRIADRSDPVPDRVWEEAARHYDERELSDLVLHIAVINLWNRINVAIRQPAGASATGAALAVASGAREKA